jgi:hypothetical protein
MLLIQAFILSYKYKDFQIHIFRAGISHIHKFGKHILQFARVHVHSSGGHRLTAVERAQTKMIVFDRAHRCRPT